MKGTWIFYRKEMLEMSRSFKLLWIPIVFAILGIMQPVVSLYMPEILKMSGGVPPEMFSLYEIPSSPEVMIQVLSQYSTLGVLILVLAGMNSVSGERYGGTAELIMVRPISCVSIIISKWLAQSTQLLMAFGIGYTVAFFYTYQMIGAFSWKSAVASFGLYGLWLMLAVTLTLLFSTILRGAAAAFVTLSILALLSLLQGILPTWFTWSPARLTSLAAEAMMGNALPVSTVVVCCLITVGIIIVTLLSSSHLLQRRVLPN
ncbi:ABC transporter permease subunit [Paenibacillus sp. FA6]|uniref:ABC transporter permease subunit n=1 Tax=Paenibacillus sp. FA6 TaxID=3413029 RepID=UPI003F65F9F9